MLFYTYVIVGGRFPWSKPSVQRLRKIFSDNPFIRSDLYGLDADIKKQREMLERMDEINKVAHLFLVTKNLARSEAALDKLSELLGEADNNVEKTVLPVFYGVDPSDVRHQTGSFAQAFADHEIKYKDDPQKVKRWRAALTKLANLAGWVSKDWHETELIPAVIHKIRKHVPSTPACRRRHDVFLSFRGKDTRLNFTDHLYAALIQCGISTFRDDKDLEKGKSIPKELDKAIEGSKVWVVIVSPDYASSKWCLNELLKILECAFEDSSLPQHHEKAHNLESRYKINKWKASLQNKEDISNHNKRKMVKLSLTVNYGGERASPVYTGDKTKEIVISDDSTPDELLDQIYSFVGVDPKQNESNTDDNQRIFIGKSLSSSTGFKNPLRNACERRMTEVLVLVNYDGEWVNSTYVGRQTKGIVISEDITYQGLVERVYGVVGVDPHEYKLILKTRYESKLPTQPVEIINDDDLAFFIKENLSRDMSSRIPLCTTLERRSFPYGRVESSENSNTAHINRFGTYHSYFHGWTPDLVPYLQLQPFYQQQQPSYQQTWTWQPYYKPSYQQLQWGYQQPHHSYMPPQSSCQQPPEIFWHHYQPHMYPPTSYQ